MNMNKTVSLNEEVRDIKENGFSLNGKAAIVTGAGGGIGRAIAVAFGEAGASVACIDLDLERAEATAAAVTATGAHGIAIRCDVASEDDTRAAVDRTVATFGGLHVLLNCAAASDPSSTVVSCTPADWDMVFAINVRSAFLMSKWAVPAMERNGGGSIIHVASQLGRVGAPQRAVYCATKGALIQLAKAMAIDHASQNIRVNALSPGAVETPRMMRFGSMEAARAELGPKHLLGRLGLPHEIAAAAVFLASDASSFMTGADLLVDGGFTAI
jgi:NAD(P)-dependent dehydrogenase (short-subunit alcohol dehydrogenase family)